MCALKQENANDQCGIRALLFFYIDEVWIWKYKFEELKSFERRRENTRVSFSDNSALPIVIKFNLKKKLSLLKKNGK